MALPGPPIAYDATSGGPASPSVRPPCRRRWRAACRRCAAPRPRDPAARRRGSAPQRVRAAPGPSRRAATRLDTAVAAPRCSSPFSRSACWCWRRARTGSSKRRGDGGGGAGRGGAPAGDALAAPGGRRRGGRRALPGARERARDAGEGRRFVRSWFRRRTRHGTSGGGFTGPKSFEMLARTASRWPGGQHRRSDGYLRARSAAVGAGVGGLRLAAGATSEIEATPSATMCFGSTRRRSGGTLEECRERAGPSPRLQRGPGRPYFRSAVMARAKVNHEAAELAVLSLSPPLRRLRPRRILERVVAKVNGEISRSRSSRRASSLPRRAASRPRRSTPSCARTTHASCRTRSTTSCILQKGGRARHPLRPGYLDEVIDDIKKENNIQTTRSSRGAAARGHDPRGPEAQHRALDHPPPGADPARSRRWATVARPRRGPNTMQEGRRTPPNARVQPAGDPDPRGEARASRAGRGSAPAPARTSRRWRGRTRRRQQGRRRRPRGAGTPGDLARRSRRGGARRRRRVCLGAPPARKEGGRMLADLSAREGQRHHSRRRGGDAGSGSRRSRLDKTRTRSTSPGCARPGPLDVRVTRGPAAAGPCR